MSYPWSFLQMRLQNIVEFLANYSFPWQGRTRKSSPTLQLSLGHHLELSSANTISVVYENTKVNLLGIESLGSAPRLYLPQIPNLLPRFLRSASFNVTFLDGVMRVTRGDRGELRIFLKDDDNENRITAFTDYED